MRRRKTRTTKRELSAAVAAALCLAGCGGADERTAPPPKLPRPLASSLAERSDAVAAALAENDPCRALAAAQSLRRQTVDAINSGRVPRAFHEELTASVNDLAGRIACVPPPEQEEPNDGGKGHGKKKGKEKGKKHGKDD